MRQPSARAVAMSTLSPYEKPWAALISNAPLRIESVSQRIRPRGPHRLDIEPLEHLNRQRTIVSSQQRDGSLSFDAIRGICTDGG